MEISATDSTLIAELKSKIAPELQLVPAYNDDLSLLRWIVGWDRKVDVVVPKIKNSLRAIHALGLDKVNLSTLEKVTEYCDAVSIPLQYLPGSLIGFDKDGNVVSLQVIGRLDAAGLMPCTRNSDLYKMRIAESEGVMQIIREREKRMGRQLGTAVIFDLEGISVSMIDMQAMKVITTMLSQLQEMFPDVIRKIFIINAPSFIQLIWSAVSPCLAKQTLQKVEFLGENYKDRLREAIGEEILFEHWGGTRKASTEFGNVRMGGKVPPSLRYDTSQNLAPSMLKKLIIPARSTSFIPLEVKEAADGGRQLHWWWQVEGGDVSFAVLRSSSEQEPVAESSEDFVMFPKFRLQTIFVPEEGEVDASVPGVYKLVFDNTHSKLRSKTIRYYTEIRDDATSQTN